MKAALPAYSEVLEKFSLFKSVPQYPELCIAKKKKIMFWDWVRGQYHFVLYKPGADLGFRSEGGKVIAVRDTPPHS